MVQFLSIIFFFWISSIFVGVFKSSRFFVSLCIYTTSSHSLGRGIGPTKSLVPDNTHLSQETDFLVPRRESNPESQKRSGRRPTPYPARLPGSLYFADR